MPVKKTTHHAGHTTKHVGTTKHSKTSKHSPGKTHKKATAHKTTVHTKAKHPAHAKATGLALSLGDVACCAAEALAASLRLQGVPVRDRDALDLFRLAGGDDERGVPIVEALEAASEYGLAAVALRGYSALLPCVLGVLAQPEADPERRHGRDTRAEPRFRRRVEADGIPGGDACQADRQGDAPEPGEYPAGQLVHGASVILGVELPGPHAVLATPDGWWSWGELWCPCEFPDAVITEAWAVTWAVAA